MRLFAETREIDPVDDLLSYADPARPLAWLRRGEGFVAVTGSMPAFIRLGADPRTPRSATMAAAWRQLAAAATVVDPVQLPGTGLVGLGALVFDERSQADSVLIVPEYVIGTRDGRGWITSIRMHDADASATPKPRPEGPQWAATLGPGAQDPQGYQESVRQAVAEIDRGDYGKVVLARDLVGTVPADADLRRLARALSTSYPDTWTYAVDGLIGASPETLITVHEGTATARVLAGTIGRGADAAADEAASTSLAFSEKDRNEHQFAVDSVLDALRPSTSALQAAAEPFVLQLPNLYHLATDVAGTLTGDASSLDLVTALHPTAAVAGTPTPVALDAIARIEPFDRERYAGPVGWIDDSGDGEWAIALRCAQFERGDVREASGSSTLAVTAYAGAGIVAGSDPESELLETRVKFRPLVDALA
ncbi:isochorismate synthase [Microbacterium sp. YY-01]|uniref:isochorismate synthase n=1 Tax=Microbacterium sp. YY-01 TaxID=3421634 RepID=UPI003D17B3A4